MKKYIFAFLLIFSIAFCLSSCKKDQADNIENPEVPSVSQEQEQSDEKAPDTNKEEKNQENQEKQEKQEKPKEKENVSAQDFENLVETFNSSDNEAEKEEARKKIEEILKQVEQQQ